LGGDGWTAALLALIRLDTTFAPQGDFPVYAHNVRDPYKNHTIAQIGYDAVVCIERYEPWIVETYVTKNGPKTTELVDRKGSLNYQNAPGTSNRTAERLNHKDLASASRNLTSANKMIPFQVASNNSVFGIWKVKAITLLHLACLDVFDT
jgi:hypothetical protein